MTFAGTKFTTVGLVNGESVASVTLTSGGAAATAIVAGSPYAIVAERQRRHRPGELHHQLRRRPVERQRAALTITAKNATKTYGGVVTFAGTEFTTSTLFNGDSVKHVSLSSAGAAATATSSIRPTTFWSAARRAAAWTTTPSPTTAAA